MRYLLLLAPLGFFLTSCGTSQSTYRDFDGSYSWSNSQAYRDGYESGYQQGYQEGADDQVAQEDQDGRPARITRTRTIVRYEYYPTYYYQWSQPWMRHDPFAFSGGWHMHHRWNGWNQGPSRWNRWNRGWNDPWYGGGFGWNDPWYGGGYGWNDPWYGGGFGWNDPWYGGGYGWNDPWYGGYGWNPYYGYGGYNGWNNRNNRWNRPGGGWTQPGGGSGSGTVDPTPDSDIRRQQINSSSTPYRRPVVTNNPGGGIVDPNRPAVAEAERGLETNPTRPSSGTRPGTINDDTPTRGTAPVRPSTNTREPQGGTPAVRQPEVRTPASRQPEVRKPEPAKRQPEVRKPEPAQRQPEVRRSEPAARQPEFRQPPAPRSTPSAPVQRSNPAPSNGIRRP
jgi:hypothetical protein